EREWGPRVALADSLHPWLQAGAPLGLERRGNGVHGLRSRTRFTRGYRPAPLRGCRAEGDGVHGLRPRARFTRGYNPPPLRGWRGEAVQGCRPLRGVTPLPRQRSLVPLGRREGERPRVHGLRSPPPVSLHPWLQAGAPL